MRFRWTLLLLRAAGSGALALRSRELRCRLPYCFCSPSDALLSFRHNERILKWRCVLHLNISRVSLQWIDSCVEGLLASYACTVCNEWIAKVEGRYRRLRRRHRSIVDCLSRQSILIQRWLTVELRHRNWLSTEGRQRLSGCVLRIHLAEGRLALDALR